MGPVVVDPVVLAHIAGAPASLCAHRPGLVRWATCAYHAGGDHRARLLDHHTNLPD